MGYKGLTAEAVWEIASRRLRQRNENSFVQWFSKMLPLRVEEKVLVLGVPDDFFGQLAEDCCGDFLAEALLQIEGVDYSYLFEAGHCAIDLNSLRPLTPVPSEKKCAEAVNDEPEQPELFAFESEEPAAVKEEAPIPAAPAAAALPEVEKLSPAAKHRTVSGNIRKRTLKKSSEKS